MLLFSALPDTSPTRLPQGHQLAMAVSHPLDVEGKKAFQSQQSRGEHTKPQGWLMKTNWVHSLFWYRSTSHQGSLL